MSNKFTWREKEIGLKFFYQLSKEEKEAYVKEIEKLPAAALSTGDKYILNFYSAKKNNFISINEELDLN
jgi:hypothetical protein